jgi:hypothetical protein
LGKKAGRALEASVPSYVRGYAFVAATLSKAGAKARSFQPGEDRHLNRNQAAGANRRRCWVDFDHIVERLVNRLFISTVTTSRRPSSRLIPAALGLETALMDGPIDGKNPHIFFIM